MKLSSLVAISAAGFALFITVVSIEMKPRLEDSEYNDVVTMKDVRADVLPPPKFVIEPYLVLLELGYADDAATRESLIQAWRTLEAAFDDRQRYWEHTLPDGALKNALEVDSTASARELFALGDTEIIPAARAGDRARLRALLAGPAQAIYRRHRSSIDGVVEVVDRQSDIYIHQAAETIARRKTGLAGFGIATVVLCGVLGWAIARGLARRISATVVALGAVASGDFSRRLRDGARDELGAMAAALDEMTEQLGQVARDVAGATAGAAPEPVADASSAGEPAPSRPTADLVSTAFDRPVRASEPVRPSAGAARSFDEGYSTFYKQLAGQVSTLIDGALAFDAEHRRAEARAALLADLERKNAELETFSYSVSHDLRAPLRIIEYFTELVLAEHGDALGADGCEHLRRVHQAAQRMSALIGDLLELARVDRADFQPEPVDLARIALRIGDRLRALDPERRVELVVPESLVVAADPRLTEILLENLLANAWKFTRKVSAPRVELGVLARDEPPTFFVRDNGAGFDPTAASLLFAPFQRLHADDEFAGTGIGLATVKRIVVRHGGTVWADGAIDGGATIYWTLARRTA